MKEPGAGKGSKQNGGGKNGGKNDTGKSTSPAKREGNPVGWDGTFDAMFLTRAAIENFVVPFYNSRRAGEGDRIMEAYASRADEIYAVGHMPGCNIVYLMMEDVARADGGQD